MFKTAIVFSLIYFNYAIETPIIGILSQETEAIRKYFPDQQYDSYIAASYVKFLESAGARVTPIWIGQNTEYYERVVNYTNGVLFPGGATYFDVPGGYAETAKKIYDLALDANNRGDYYPIWGTCLGLQVLSFVEVGKDVRAKQCTLLNKAIPLDFVEGFEESRLFSNAPKDIISSLVSQNVTFNYHQFCLTKEVLKSNGILNNWKILATNRDELGEEYISVMESVKYPIFGVQFHPEKNQFEFKKEQIPHKVEAVKISQYFANFFVDQSRKSSHSFPTKDMETAALIYNYNPNYTGKTNYTFEQIYLFEKDDFKKEQLD